MADAKIRIQGDVSGFTDSMQQAERSVDGFSVSLGKVDKNANSLKAAMKTATKQAQDLAFQLSKMSDVELQSDFGQQLQAQFQTAMKVAADLKDQFGDVNQEIKNLASDTTGLDAFTQGIGVMSSGLSGLASIYGLVGGNTEKFAQALVAVNAVQNISNTITGIANALQKQSALMVGLRAAKNAILGTSITAVTAAETANTAALGAETAATTAATGATWSFNAALAANPIGAVVVAVAAAAAAIYALVNVLNEATDAEKGEAEAILTAKDATLAGYDAYKKNEIELSQLKKQVDNFRGSKEEEKKLVEELNRKYGDSLGYYKDLNSWKSALANTTMYYCKVLQAEANLNALNAEAAKAWAAAMAGDDYSQNMAKYNKLRELAADALDDVMFYNRQLEISKNLHGALSSNPSKSTSSSSKKTTKSTKEEKTALEQLETQIKNVEKQIKSLDKTTDNYDSVLKKLKGDLASLKIKKLNYIDRSTIEGATEYRKELKSIFDLYDTVPDNLLQNLKETDETLLNLVKDASKSDDMELLKKAENSIVKIVETLPRGSAELKTWAEMLRTVRSRGREIQQELDDITSGIDPNSERGLEDYIKKLEDAKKNWAPGMDFVPDTKQLTREFKDLGRNLTLGEVDLEIDDAREKLGKLKELLKGVEVNAPVQPEEIDYFSYRDMPQPKKVDIDKLADTYIKGLDDELEQIEDALERAYTHRDRGIAEGFDTTTIDNAIQQLEDTQENLLRARDKVINDTAESLANSYYTEDLDKMTDRELSGMKRYIETLIGYEQKYIDEYARAAEQAYGIDKKLLENSRQIHETIRKGFEKQSIYIEIKADIKEYERQIDELREDTAKDFLSATEGLYDVFADLPHQLDECENAAEGFFKVMEAGFSIFDQIKTIIQDFKELSELFKQLSGAKVALGAVDSGSGSVGIGGVPVKEKMDPLFERRQELLAVKKAEETEASGAVAQAANQAAGALDNLAGSASRAAGSIGTGASPQPPATEGVDMVSLAGGGADSEFEITPVLNTDPIEDQVDQLKEVIVDGLGSGLQDALTVPDGMEDIINGMNEAAVAQEGLTAAKEAGAMAQEGLTAAQQIGNVTTEAGTAVAAANTVATASQTAATEGQAIANVGEAVSETAKQNSKLGPFGWVAAIAAGAALFASLMSMMKFAEGGIVGGSTTIGDRVVARLNAGEMVLNKNQQSKLFNLIDHGVISNDEPTSTIVKVRGSDLILALNNYSKVHGRASIPWK